MPWKTSETMDLRCKFVLLAKEEGSNFSELCRSFGISRRTGYKWLGRYETGGMSALSDQSRRPHNNPNATSVEVVIEIVRLRTLKPTWGAKKIKAYMHRNFECSVPSRVTIERILERSGLIQRRKRRRLSKTRVNEKIVIPEKPNDVWTVDFKGWWQTLDKNRVEPLTIRDEYSKFIIDIKGMPTTRQEPVRQAFKRAFECYGLPKYIRSDNGTPFVSPCGLGGLTKLSVWWLKQGVKPNRIKPGSPQENGGHERMHRDMKLELQKHAGRDLPHQQELFDIWREEFNTERPHEALEMKTPSDVYQRSHKKYDPQQPEFEYPCTWEVRKVAGNAETNYWNRKIYLSKALIGEHVGVEKINENRIKFWFGDYPLLTVDSHQIGQRRIYLTK